MEKNSLLVFLIPIILIPFAITIPAIGLGNPDNSFSNLQDATITPAIGLDNLDNAFRDMQCGGYYGC
jgi:hypothetical protein